MTHPPQHTPPPEPGLDHPGEVDVVPGIPPVPITVWRTPTDDGDPLGRRICQRLIAAYTHPGDLVYDPTANPTLRQAATTADRRYTTTLTDPRQRAGLAVVCWPPADNTGPADSLLAGIRRRLHPGGILAATTGVPGVRVDVAGLVDTALAAGLSYLQHIVAVHTAVEGDQLTGPTGTTGPGRPGAAHLRVHTDLYIFQTLAPPAGSALRKEPGADE